MAGRGICLLTAYSRTKEAWARRRLLARTFRHWRHMLRRQHARGIALAFYIHYWRVAYFIVYNRRHERRPFLRPFWRAWRQVCLESLLWQIEAAAIYIRASGRSAATLAAVAPPRR